MSRFPPLCLGDTFSETSLSLAAADRDYVVSVSFNEPVGLRRAVTNKSMMEIDGPGVVS